MGIPNLNKFFIDNCKKNSIQKTHLSSLSGKVIAVDTSIYLYKFAADNTLIEHFYLMISIFRKYNIIPIFVFDGKPPKAKRELLLKRRQQRKQSEEQYNKLKMEIDSLPYDSDDRFEMQKELELLKRESTSISYDNLAVVKSIIKSYGVTYEQAEGEADILCVQLVNSGKAWGCMSDDMDMFVYGCSRVFRHFSLVNHNVIFYNFSAILNDLEMDIKTFREIAVLSGTDYNFDNKTSLHETIQLYEKYKLYDNNKSMDFYKWIVKTTDYINDYDTLVSIISMFDIDKSNENVHILENINQVVLEEIDLVELKKILVEDGFVFVNT